MVGTHDHVQPASRSGYAASLRGVLIMFVRLFRALPLLAILAVLAGIVYVFVSWRRSPARAKEILIKLFTALNGALCIFFALASLYAWGDGNPDVLELFLSFLMVALVALAITRICRAVFLKHNPGYRKKPMRAKKIRRWPWSR